VSTGEAKPALRPNELTAAAFAEFGDVIDRRKADYVLINGGQTRRYDDLARIEFRGKNAQPRLSLFVSQPVHLPLDITFLERHPFGSQTFVPLHEERFLVIVAPPGDTIDPLTVRAFLTDGHQGVNYHAGTWHAVHSVLDREGEFLVIDRAGEEPNCDEQGINLQVTLD
jgi:ureidoglycolate lyase